MVHRLGVGCRRGAGAGGRGGRAQRHAADHAGAAVLAGCGGSNNEDAASTPVPEAQEEQSSSSEPADEAEPETVDGTREALIALVTAFQPTDDVPLTFIECWIDKTLEFNEYEPQELLRLLTSSDEAEELEDVGNALCRFNVKRAVRQMFRFASFFVEH